MRKGFTLLELIIVIIIIGILATLGLTQYGRMVEKSRGAEAKGILGDLRKLAAGYYLEKGTVTGFDASAAGIGTSSEQIPSSCGQTTHYFAYSIIAASGTTLTTQATRCTTGTGKAPGVSTGGRFLQLTTIFPGGTDTWTTNAGY